MDHVELNPKQREQLFKVMEAVQIDPYEFGMYLREKVSEDRAINNLEVVIVSKADYNARKALLASMEYLSVVLTKE